jgi:hypothetical protein
MFYNGDPPAAFAPRVGLAVAARGDRGRHGPARRGLLAGARGHDLVLPLRAELIGQRGKYCPVYRPSSRIFCSIIG